MELTMPRYLVERTFPEGLMLPANAQGAQASAAVVANNARDGVTWIHSYVTPDRKKTLCIYDGPSPDAIRVVARANGLPVDRISEVRVLDPYFLH
jgi:Nickel responsive protein SCO4226-like